MPCGWKLANALVFKKVHEALGLDRCKLFLSGAAPIMRQTIDYFASLNIPIMEVYGMSECTGESFIKQVASTEKVKQLNLAPNLFTKHSTRMG